jgi:ABC-type multidrug transport system ATPase subunit
LAGLDRPSSGIIRRRQSVRVMVVMQRPEDHFSEACVGEQIASYARGVLLTTGRAEVLARVGLTAEALNWPLRELSSGHQRLVAIACALVTGAPFLALDEPMAGLDSAGRRLVSDDRRSAVLIVSHHPDDLLGLVERLLILDQGQLAYDGLFATAPLAALHRCIAEPAQSLYYTLRRLEEGGMHLGSEVYAKRDPSLIWSEMLAAEISQ